MMESMSHANIKSGGPHDRCFGHVRPHYEFLVFLSSSAFIVAQKLVASDLCVLINIFADHNSWVIYAMLAQANESREANKGDESQEAQAHEEGTSDESNEDQAHEEGKDKGKGDEAGEGPEATKAKESWEVNDT